jgi:uncharacterized protein (TIGR03435 family)
MRRDKAVVQAVPSPVHPAGWLHRAESADVLFFLVFLLLSGWGAPAYAQDNSAVQHLPGFVVASIRPTSGNGPCGFTADGFRCASISAKQLVKMAYHVDTDSRISDVPVWAQSTNYQILAKVDESDLPAFSALPYEQRLLMLRPLLESRFNLEVHWIAKELPVYALTVAKGEAKLQSSQETTPRVVTYLSGKTEGKGVPIEMLIQAISPFVDRIIIDDTKLAGKYDFSLQLPRLHANQSGTITSTFGGEHGSQTDPAASDLSEPSIYASIAELGLKLQPRKASLQVLVMDRFSQPSSN